MFAWLGKFCELCPQGGQHDWEVTRTVTAEAARDAAWQLFEDRPIIPSPTCGDEARYADRACIKCGKVELLAHDVIEEAKRKHVQNRNRTKLANEMVAAAIAKDKQQ